MIAVIAVMSVMLTVRLGAVLLLGAKDRDFVRFGGYYVFSEGLGSDGRKASHASQNQKVVV